VDHRRDRQPDHRRIRRSLLGQVVLVGDRLARGEVGAAEQHSVDVFMAPHDALGEAGGAAGVKQVDVVLAARTEVTFRRALRQRRLEFHATVFLVVVVGPVLDDEDGLDVRGLGQHVGHPVGVAALVHQRHHVRVLEQVLQLALDVAEVDVDQDGAGLHGAQHRDHYLDAVAAVEADLVVFAHALIDQVVREAVGLLLELAVGELFAPTDQGDAVRHGVDGVLGKVSDVQGHGPKLERVTFPDKSLASTQKGGLP
jgi:hypothetical protein